MFTVDETDITPADSMMDSPRRGVIRCEHKQAIVVEAELRRRFRAMGYADGLRTQNLCIATYTRARPVIHAPIDDAGFGDFPPSFKGRVGIPPNSDEVSV